MSNKPSLDYLGRVSGNVKNSINSHTVKAEDIMIPKPVVNGGNVIGLKIVLD